MRSCLWLLNSLRGCCCQGIWWKPLWEHNWLKNDAGIILEINGTVGIARQRQRKTAVFGSVVSGENAKVNV